MTIEAETGVTWPQMPAGFGYQRNQGKDYSLDPPGGIICTDALRLAQ